MAASFIVFSSGCVLNPQEGDVLRADRKVTSDFCPIEPGTNIVLGHKNEVHIGAGQYDSVWNATAPGCGDIGIANDTVVWSFSRVKP